MMFDHKEPITGVSPDVSNLSTFFAKIITSKHNQHALVRIVGRAGKGKSWYGMGLAFGVAEKVAEILGGNPIDYFNIKEDLGIISKKEIMRVMKDPKMHSIKFLDDVAVAWNARKYNDKFNIDLNDLIQTFRPNHNLVIMTMQSGFLVDKVPRSLVHFQIEMDRPFFDRGVTLAKVFELQLNEDTGLIYRHYLRGAGGIYVRHLCKAPPKEIMEAYEIERGIQLKQIEIDKQQEKEEEVQKIKKKDYAVQFIDMLCAEYGLSVNAACNKAGVSRTYYDRIKA